MIPSRRPGRRRRHAFHTRAAAHGTHSRSHRPGRRLGHTMMNDMNDIPWFVTWTTYGSWLPGDPRGFRTFRGKEYVPPPERYAKDGEPVYDANQYAQRYAKAKEQVPDEVRLTPAEQKLVCDAVVAQLEELRIPTHIIAVGPIHIHLIARFGTHLIRPTVGRLKSFATRALPNPGCRKRVWTKNCHMQSLNDDAALANATKYVGDHLDEGAIIWECQAAAWVADQRDHDATQPPPRGAAWGMSHDQCISQTP